MDSLLHFRMRLNINCLIKRNDGSNYTILTGVLLSLPLASAPIISDIFFNGISGSQKDCDLPKTTVLHGSNTFGQLQSQTSNDNSTSNNNNTRLHVSGGICDSHTMHQDQVSVPKFQ